ncbi:uncharacterized protein LOC121405333 [Drosophila obscura]|uniref:uncharacterized protein LOC121405333 n=1 Tax=Drosophila obscura TaxID=7282 RepID=UPI001BB11A0E|nr:uncharacterized protein LOC121405333 [Drosophila obscura]
MSVQTSVESMTATIGGYGQEQSSLRVAIGHNSNMAGAGHISFKATATKTPYCKLSSMGAVVETDSDLESVLSVSRTEEESLLRSPEPGSSSLRKEGRLQEDISQEEKSNLAWAEQKVEEGRLHYAQLPQMKATKGDFANKVEEMMATTRQRSIESVKDTPAGKRQRGPKKPKQKDKLSDVSKRHLIVALIDRSDENGKMTAAQWKQVHAQLVESLFARMEDAPNASMPTFDGAGWLNGVKILKCNDYPTRKWLVQVVPQLEALWKRAKGG